MSVAVLITAENQVEELVTCGQFLAKCDSTDLYVLVLQKSSAQKQWIEIEPGSKLSDDLPPLVTSIAQRLFESVSNSVTASPEIPETTETEGADHASEPEEADQQEHKVSIRILKDRQPEWALVDEINGLGIKILALPEFSVGKSAPEESSWRKSLYRQAPCETIQVDTNSVEWEKPIRVLAVTTGAVDDLTAIRRGQAIAESSGGTVTATCFQPDIDAVAIDVGNRILQNLVDSAVGKKSDQVQTKVVLANSFKKGLSFFDYNQFDLVICGTRNIRESARFLSIPAIKNAKPDLGLITVRKPIPLANRFVNRVRVWLEGFVPQLKRDQRIELVKRIQTSSKWDFDFGMLICLSTLIAALGLVRNSASVVIGAMLIAPLMTPIVGTGLGLSQSNQQLVKSSMRTVWRGFATAFVIGLFAGLLTSPTITDEMAARGSPNFIDLLIAWVSGIAAAYAMGRPNLLSALPGVAIAAALVPPLATSGMATAVADFPLAYGSLLLFFTNIVAIILGTTMTFWLVGVRKTNESPAESWPFYLFSVFVLITIVLTVVMSWQSAVVE